MNKGVIFSIILTFSILQDLISQDLKYRKDSRLAPFDITLTLTLNEDNQFKFILKNRANDKSESFILNTLSFVNFSSEIKEIYKIWGAHNLPFNSDLKNLFVDINENYPDTPLAGEITINKEANVYKDFCYKKPFMNYCDCPEIPDFIVEIENVSIEINEGQILNIIVETKFKCYEAAQSLKTGDYDPNGKRIVFTNITPIPFSKIRDFRRSINRCIYLHSVLPTTQLGKYYSLRLSQIIDNYIPFSKTNRRDYSPKPGTFFLTPGKHYLNKENIKDLFSLRIYTDLIGLGPQPNGLIQTEFEKDINLYITPLPWKLTTSYFNFLYKIKPYVTIARIEGENYAAPAYYNVDASKISITGKPDYYINLMEMKKYENFVAGIKLSYISFTVPDFATRFELASEVSFHNTLMEGPELEIDDTNEYVITGNDITFNGVAFEIAPAIINTNFYPSEYFSFGIEYVPYIRNKILNNDEVEYVQDKVSNNNLDTTINYLNKYNYSRIEFYGSFYTNKENHLFARYRFNWQNDNVENFFQQFQLGYLIKLTPKKSDLK